MTERRSPIVAAVVVHDGRVLMVRRRVSEGSLSWQFPAGERESGETPFATAVRETREEVGLNVAPQTVLGEREHPVTGRRMVYVSCAVDGGSTASLVDTEELAALAWCGWSQLIEKVPTGLFPAVRDHLQTVLTL
ncbi:MAG: NUDIX domain-containing protein [Micromonosporaceae bacterium]|nr:NUDIX domain-containing protein [Micromonosporaceae bacterium]